MKLKPEPPIVAPAKAKDNAISPDRLNTHFMVLHPVEWISGIKVRFRVRFGLGGRGL